MVTQTADVSFSGLIERFLDGIVAGAADGLVREALVEAAPPAELLVGPLLHLVPRVDEEARFAIATLAVELAADPGYRPVVEAVVRNHPLGPEYRPWLVVRGATLTGDALRWWLDLVADELPTAPLHHALLRRVEVVLDRDRDLVVAYLLRSDRGPARHAAELAAEVLARGGPCPAVEAMFSRWILQGLFDEDVPDTQDGGTSAQVLASCLERCVVDGPFDTRWSLVGEALEHWRGLLSSEEPGQRGRGLVAMATLLMFRHSVGGALPSALADRGSRRRPEWRSIERGFAAVTAARRSRRRAARLDVVIRGSAEELMALAAVDHGVEEGHVPHSRP